MKKDEITQSENRFIKQTQAHPRLLNDQKAAIYFKTRARLGIAEIVASDEGAKGDVVGTQ